MKASSSGLYETRKTISIYLNELIEMLKASLKPVKLQKVIDNSKHCDGKLANLAIQRYINDTK